MSEFGLYLGPELIEETANAADMNLTAPSSDDNPTFRPGNKPGHGTWTETLKIVDSDFGPPSKRPDSKTEVVMKLVCDVLGPEADGYNGNVGKAFYFNAYIDKPALLNKADKGHRTNARRIALVNSLIVALGGEVKGGVDYEVLFKGDADGSKQLVGQTVKAVIRKSDYVPKGQTEPKESVDVQGFLPA